MAANRLKIACKCIRRNFFSLGNLPAKPASFNNNQRPRRSRMAIDIARALKDPEYRKSLTQQELASLAGSGELSEGELASISGGAGPEEEEEIQR
jgi:mersacidin/lichenicidin family type 2 lantibiotic